MDMQRRTAMVALAAGTLVGALPRGAASAASASAGNDARLAAWFRELVERGAEVPADEAAEEVHAARLEALEEAIFTTPAHTVRGAAVKARLAYRFANPERANAWGDAPPDPAMFAPRDDAMLLWHLVRDLLRLTGETA